MVGMLTLHIDMHLAQMLLIKLELPLLLHFVINPTNTDGIGTLPDVEGVETTVVLTDEGRLGG